MKARGYCPRGGVRFNPNVNACHVSDLSDNDIIVLLEDYICAYYDECPKATWRDWAEVLSWIPILGIPATVALAGDDIKNGRYLSAAINIASVVPVGKLAKLGKACSFSGDTQVLMADGTTKPIDEINVGDEVIATDPETGKQSPQKVTAVWVHDDKLTDLLLEDGSAVTTTEDHPFWNATDHQWQRADTISPGDRLLSPDGQHPRAAGIRLGPTLPTPAYNLTIAHSHTYYVLAGDTPVLVHNTAPGCGTLINEGPGPKKAYDVLGRVDAKGAPFSGYKGGREFANDGSHGATVLPGGNGVTYREWDVNPNIKGVDRGGERLVTGSDGSAWYTNDHYKSFFRLR
jgi:guanyl-specific ribonuclease Sa